MTRPAFKRMDYILAGVLALAALLLYLATMALGPFPGESARFLAQYSGLEPIPPMGYPVWVLLMKLLAGWTTDLALIANMFSAICGALTVGLTYLFIAGLSRDRTKEETKSVIRTRITQRVSGVIGALFLTLIVPFWAASNRAHPLSFHALILLAMALWFSRIWRADAAKHLPWFWIAYGVLCLEYPLLVPISLLFLGASLLVVFRVEEDRVRNIIGILAGSFGGCVLAFVIAFALFASHPGYAWFEFDAWWEGPVALLRFYYQTVRGSLFNMGWILIALLLVLPWFVVMMRKQFAQEKGALLGSYILHGVLLALGFLLLFDHQYSPLSVLEYQRLIVAPYVLGAIWFGYVAGYWFAILGGRRRQSGDERYYPTPLLAKVYVGIVAVLLGFGGVHNLSVANARVNRLYVDILHRVVDEIETDPAWLVTASMLDSPLRVVAHKQGKSPRLININNARHPIYVQYMKSLFEEPRLQTLSEFGISTLFNEWVQLEPEWQDRIVIMDAPDLWAAVGIRPISAYMVYRGAPMDTPVDAVGLYERHVEFWQEVQDRIATVNQNPFIRRAYQQLLLQASKVANDAGVLLEEEGEEHRAFAAYGWARQLYADNLSAALNQTLLSERIFPDELPRLEEELKQLVNAFKQRDEMWQLATRYGYVRNPQAYFARGQAWVASGRMDVGLAEWQRADASIEEQSEAQLFLGAVLFEQRDWDRAEAIYLGLLERNPDSREALQGLLQVAISRGDPETARERVEALMALGEPASAFWRDLAIVEAMSGNMDAARRHLDRILQNSPNDPNALILLAFIEISVNDEAAAAVRLEQLLRQHNLTAPVLFAAAQAMVSLERHTDAQALLERVLRANPRHMRALEMMLVYDWQFARRDEAMGRIRSILAQDSGNFLANLVLGTIQMSRQEFGLAESSYRRSLERRLTFEALTDLAWILQNRGGYDEALRTARQALEMQPQRSAGWHTLGLVLLRMGRLEESERALERALALEPENWHARAYTAFLFVQRGLLQEAESLLDQILLQGEVLVPAVDSEARDTLLRIRRGEIQPS